MHHYTVWEILMDICFSVLRGVFYVVGLAIALWLIWLAVSAFLYYGWIVICWVLS